MEREGWKSKAAMRRHLEQKYFVPKNPYLKPNLTKKDYEILKTIDFDTILNATEVKRTVKKWKDPKLQVTSAMIEGPDIVKIAPKKRRLSKEQEEENRAELAYTMSVNSISSKIDKTKAK